MKFAVLAALKKEISGIVRETGLTRPAGTSSPFRFFEGRWGGHDLLVGNTGAGKVLAAAATQAVCDRFSPRAILLCGTAGSLSPDLRPLDLVIPEKAMAHDADPDTTRWIRTDFSLSSTLVAVCRSVRPDNCMSRSDIITGDRPVFSREVREELAARTGAVAVDMESSAVVKVATLNRVPVAVLKAVTDHADSKAESDFRRNLMPAVERVQEAVLYLLAHLRR